MTDQTESAVTLNHGETTILYELISELCERTSDGGSIPPQAWRTAANKMQAARLAFDEARNGIHATPDQGTQPAHNANLE